MLFTEGKICRIKSGAPGKQNCWYVVAQISQDEYVVDTWDNQYTVSISDPQEMRFTRAEWKEQRNQESHSVNWRFTTADACIN